MFKKKFMFVLFTVLLSGLLLTACGDDSSSNGDKGGETFDITYSTWASDGEPAYEGMEKFKEIVEEKSEGNITVELFPANQLGGTIEQIEQLELNTIQMMSSGSPGMKEIEYLALPYLMNSNKHWLEVLNSEVGKQWKQKLIDDQGIRIVGVLPRGPRVVTANKEIHTPADMEGLKMRVPERDYYVETFKAFGVKPTPLDFGEVYSALQTGVVSGQENPLETAYAAGFQEVQDYVIETNHMFKPAFVTMNDEFLQSMPEDYQQIVLDAVEEANTYAEEVMAENHSTMKKEMKDAGVTFIKPDLAPFIEATESVRKTLGTKMWGEETYQKIVEIGKKELSE